MKIADILQSTHTCSAAIECSTPSNSAVAHTANHGPFHVSVDPPPPLPPLPPSRADVAGPALGKDKFPVLYGWMERMKATKAVRESLLPVEAHLAVIEGLKAGKHDAYAPADLTGKGLHIYTKEE